MITLPITSHFVAILALMLIALSVHVIRFRTKHKLSLGDGGIKGLQNAVRAQGNLTEYAPIFLILFGLIELQDKAADWLLLLIGSVFVLARMSHAYSLNVVEMREGALEIRFRVAGMMGTFSSIGLLTVILLF